MTHVVSRGIAPRRLALGLVGRILAWDATYRSRQHLADMPEERLADIGLTRAGTPADAWPAASWMKQPW